MSRFAFHHLPDFWKQVALIRIARALRPAGRFYLRDVVFSFDPPSYEATINAWVRRMPEVSGFSQSEFETHVREEYSTFSWVLEGFLERAGLQIVQREYPAPEYAEYLCRPREGPPSNKQFAADAQQLVPIDPWYCSGGGRRAPAPVVSAVGRS